MKSEWNSEDGNQMVEAKLIVYVHVVHCYLYASGH